MSLSARSAPAGPTSPARPAPAASRTRQPIVGRDPIPHCRPRGGPGRRRRRPAAPTDRGWQAPPAVGRTRPSAPGAAPTASDRRPGGASAGRRRGAAADAGRRPGPDGHAAAREAGMAAQPTAAPVMPPAVNAAELGGQSISLQLALYGALTSNPDLVALRKGNPCASPEAVEVARRFPTTLNPTVWIDYRPITLIPPDTFGTAPSPGGARRRHHGRLLPLRPELHPTSRSGSRSSWGTRPPTATTSPRPPTSSSNGPWSRPS